MLENNFWTFLKKTKKNKRGVIFNSIRLDVLKPEIQKLIISSMETITEYIGAFKVSIEEEIEAILECDPDTIKKKKIDLQNYRASKKVLSELSNELLAKNLISFYLRLVSGIKSNDFRTMVYLNSCSNLIELISRFYYSKLFKIDKKNKVLKNIPNDMQVLMMI